MFSNIGSIFVVLFLLCITPLAAFGQETAGLEVGDIVRVELDKPIASSGYQGPYRGKVVRTGADFLEIQLSNMAPVRRFSYSEISTVERKSGGTSRDDGGTYGAFIGLGVAVIAGLAPWDSDEATGVRIGMSSTTRILAYSSILVPLGYLAGRGEAGNETWEQVSFSATAIGVGATSNGGIGIQLSMGF